MRLVINFNTGGGNYWTVLCIVFSFLEKLCYVGRGGSFLYALYILFRSELQFFLSLFNFLVSILCCEGLFLLSCSSVYFFFLGLLSSSFFLFFCLLLLSCSSVFFFFLVLLSSSSFLDFVWGVTYCSIEGLVSRVFARSLHEYFVTWWVFFSFFLELFLGLLCLDLLSCCVRARFFRWWDGLADLLQSGLLLRTGGSVSLPESRHVGAQGIILNYR